MTNELKIMVIDFIDYVTEKLYHKGYEKELSELRRKYIFKDISQEEFQKDINRLKYMKELCEYKTNFFYNEN